MDRPNFPERDKRPPAPGTHALHNVLVQPFCDGELAQCTLTPAAESPPIGKFVAAANASAATGFAMPKIAWCLTGLLRSFFAESVHTSLMHHVILPTDPSARLFFAVEDDQHAGAHNMLHPRAKLTSHVFPFPQTNG